MHKETPTLTEMLLYKLRIENALTVQYKLDLWKILVSFLWYHYEPVHFILNPNQSPHYEKPHNTEKIPTTI